MNDKIKIIENPEINMLKGYKSNGICCEIKRKDKPDFGIVMSETKATVFAKYTTNKYQAAPILVCKDHLKDGKAQILIVNSGNANACTGDEGITNANKICDDVARIFNVESKDVVISSTGVIGQQLPMEKILPNLTKLKNVINEKNNNNFSQAIMTTDTKMKIYGVSIKTNDKEYKIIGTCKGSGMIHPNMATMLGYVFTDCKISDKLLENSFATSIEKSFNSISVDGDTSTNDTIMIFANGMAGNCDISKNDTDFEVFNEGLNIVMRELAKKIIEDGEGATKLIEIEVKNAKSEKDAKTIAVSIARSPLVKTAFFGEDANWGRIICAVGYSGVDFDTEKVGLYFDKMKVFENGKNLDFSEDEAKNILGKKDVKVTVDMAQGNKSWTYWTCDLSYDYVKINGSYRT